MNSERGFQVILSDLVNDLLEYADTRFNLLKEELQERAAVLKHAMPLLVSGVLFLTAAFLLFTVALVTIVAAGFPENPYRWFFSALIVGALWSSIGLIALYVARQRADKMRRIVPQKTLQVLREDKSRLVQDLPRKVA